MHALTKSVGLFICGSPMLVWLTCSFAVVVWFTYSLRGSLVICLLAFCLFCECVCWVMHL